MYQQNPIYFKEIKPLIGNVKPFQCDDVEEFVFNFVLQDVIFGHFENIFMFISLYSPKYSNNWLFIAKKN